MKASFMTSTMSGLSVLWSKGNRRVFIVYVESKGYVFFHIIYEEAIKIVNRLFVPLKSFKAHTTTETRVE